MATSNNGNNSTKSEIAPDVKYDTGILTVKRVDGKDLPGMNLREIVVTVHTTLIDRYEGTVAVEKIWSDQPNIRLITESMMSADIRLELAQFFMSRRIERAIVALIDVRTVRPGDTMITKPSLFKALSEILTNRTAANVVMELVNAYLIKVGIVSDVGTYTQRFTYHFEPVTVTRIGNDVAAHEVVRVMEQAKVIDIADRKYSKEAFAEAVATALYDLGRAFLDINSLTTIVEDVVKGIRASVDPGLVGLTGFVDPTWRDHDVVETLSTNWVFLEEALSLPAGTDVTPANQGWKLDKVAPGILAAIKSSQRYAIVGKIEAARNIGTLKVRDLRGRATTVVFYRNAKPDPVGMSVYAYEDDALPGAYTLTHTKERLGEVVAHAYGSVDNLGTHTVAKMLHSTLTDVVEGGFTDLPLMYHIDLGGYAFVENRTLAALLASRVSVFFDENDLVVRDESIARENAEGDVVHDIKMWYGVPTKERDLSWQMSGRFDQGSYLTSSVGEVFLAMDELIPSGVIEAKPQLYTTAAFNSRIVNFDPRSLRKADIRYPFAVEVHGAKIHGSIKPTDLGSMKANPFTSLVVPVYNREVFSAVAQTFDTMLDVARRLKRETTQGSDRHPEYTGGTALPAFLERRVGREILAYAKNVAPSFRAEIHQGMMNRALIGMTGEQSIALRARLAQKAFGAYADVVALSFFVEMQGMNGEAGKEEQSFWRRIVRDDIMAQTYFETETDRDAIP